MENSWHPVLWVSLLARRRHEQLGTQGRPSSQHPDCWKGMDRWVREFIGGEGGTGKSRIAAALAELFARMGNPIIC